MYLSHSYKFSRYSNLNSISNLNSADSYLKKSYLFNINMSRRNKILHNLPDVDDEDNSNTKLYYAPDGSTGSTGATDNKYYHTISSKPKEPILINVDKIPSYPAPPPPPPPSTITVMPIVSAAGITAEKTVEKTPVKEKTTTEKTTTEKTTEKTAERATDEEHVAQQQEQPKFNEEQLLFNLRIISELKKSDKLTYYDNQFIINEPGYKQGLYRWFYDQDRAKTLENINLLIDETFSHIDNTFKKELSEGRYESHRTERVLYENNSQKLQKFREALLDCCKGLDKLKATYEEDRSMSSGISLIVDKVKTRTDKINKIMRISV